MSDNCHENRINICLKAAMTAAFRPSTDLFFTPVWFWKHFLRALRLHLLIKIVQNQVQASFDRLKSALTRYWRHWSIGSVNSALWDRPRFVPLVRNCYPGASRLAGED